MSYKITCPYCFREMLDDEVHFRSELVNQGESGIIPEDYDDLADFQQRYRGADKEAILARYKEWEFFTEGNDKAYERFWADYNGTTEDNPADKLLGVKAFRRKVIDPKDIDHQKYLKTQNGSDYFVRDEQGMVSQIELTSGEKCNRRVCPHCHNPLPDNYGKNSVKFATVIGITGAGKTVYLAQLLKRMRTYAVKVGLNAVVNNTGVRAFLEKNNVAAKEPLPGSTPASRFQQPLFYEMIREAGGGKKTDTFVLYDVAGEVFQEQALVKKFAPFIEHADGVIVLIDPMQFEVISGAAANGKVLSEPSTVLDIIHGIVAKGRQNEKCKIPFAICISKADTQEVQSVLSCDLRNMLLDDVRGIQDAQGYNKPVFNAAEYTPIGQKLTNFVQNNELVLAQQMKINYSDYAFFAFTALGCDVEEGRQENGDVYQYPVGPVLPKRVEEPMLWLFHKLGYIDKNAALPGDTICPECGAYKCDVLPKGETMKVKVGFFKTETVPVNRRCRNCGHKWLEENR